MYETTEMQFTCCIDIAKAKLQAVLLLENKAILHLNEAWVLHFSSIILKFQ